MSRKVMAVGLACLLTSSPGMVHADDADVIEYRKNIMKTLNEQAAALGLILSSAIPDDNATRHLEIISMTASTALKSFEPQVQGGDSKPEVWKNWADFSRRMNDFAQKTASAAKTAKDRGSDEVLPNILEVLDCKGCHNVYRREKK